ncbi:MAG: transcription termination factor NusA [Chloroflexi bacterium]|nr:transcription termination factor NusA [Chloroflexota bacterium]MCY3696864.1 transcription termination factor NusA [Chloroflexota bacterium]MXX31910.1 transcription termination/antitermination protein NusA [Chloroflexota bacterium]MXX81593.1 transcription termination/antitermination protein NusA [Chloroflexota bacterium]MYB21112.1 transcription termination/antitermination protein NusA [Chloroflexota bacterium]
MKTDFLLAIKQLHSDKNLDDEVIFGAVERGMAAAVKRRYELPGNVLVSIDRYDGSMSVASELEVVEIEEDIEDPDLQIELDRARKIDPQANIGSTLRQDHDIEGVGGRIEAQTAKQVVLQALREAEREAVFAKYSGEEGGIISGDVQRVEPHQVIVELADHTETVMPAPEQVRMERYRSGQRVKAIMVEVLRANKGPQIVISRSRPEFVRRLFELEVPEIMRGVVEIRGVAREPGHRTKIAVWSRQSGVDPIGSCIGMRAMRIQNIVNELHGERVDVIQWDRDPRLFVEHALSPAQILAVRIDRETNTAECAVPDMQLSLAIGREGQNARLAARLTGFRIDIKPQTVAERMQQEGRGPFAPQEEIEIEPEPLPEPEPVRAAPQPERPAAEAPAPQPVEIPTPSAPSEEPELVEEEPELEPALQATELAPAARDEGQIRFGEELLRREEEQQAQRDRRRRRPRYHEVDEGLEDDPYAEYMEYEEEF